MLKRLDMTHETILQFLELRKENKIGRIWPEAGGFRVAPFDALPGLDYQLAELMSETALYNLIQELSGTGIVERRPPTRASVLDSYPLVNRKVG